MKMVTSTSTSERVKAQRTVDDLWWSECNWFGFQDNPSLTFSAFCNRMSEKETEGWIEGNTVS